MPQTSLRQTVASCARSLVGLKESDGSHRRVIDAYNSIRPLPRGYQMGDTDPWCAAFVSAVGQLCGLTALLLPECSCPAMTALYRKAGRWQGREGANPAPGDVVMYDWDGDGVPEHTGLLLSRSGDMLEVAEGNLADAVGIRRIDRKNPAILGFCLPDYEAAVAGETPAAQPSKPKPIPGGSLTLPVLSRGARGETVRAAQLLLIGRGFGCGPDGADGDFGANPAAAVKSFQRARSLSADGILGPLTWRALLGQ